MPAGACSGSNEGEGMTDEDWAGLGPGERAFAVRWLGLSDEQRDDFCRELLDAIEVLQRLRVLDGGSEAATAP
jgi:hypothetical protein